MKKKFVLVLFVLTLPALWAADGVIEINQAGIEADGGFPYVISEPGSYILTGNLMVPDENTTAIEIEEGVGSATIDPQRLRDHRSRGLHPEQFAGTRLL